MNIKNENLESFFQKNWNSRKKLGNHMPGLILSIHNSSEKAKPNNFQGVTLFNSLYKSFKTILYNMLSTTLKNTNILYPTKAGFLKDHITSGHSFTLFSLIKKYATKDKYIYTCFVDIQEAYNSILKDRLKEKLERISVNGKFLDLIHAL